MLDLNLDNPGQLSVCIDFQDLESLLLLKPAITLAEAQGLKLRFLPMVGEPRVSRRQPGPPDDDEMARYKAHRQKIRGNYIDMDRLRNAAMLGLTEADINPSVDTNLAALGLLWLWQAKPEAELHYVRRVFDAVFRKHKDVAQLEVVNHLVEEAGVSLRGFGEFQYGEGRVGLDAVQDLLLESGLYRAAAVYLSGEWYIGREHLPLLHWKLTGESGHPPV